MLSASLPGAIDDFSGAIAQEPRYADSWKRRGQARSALGQLEGAITDEEHMRGVRLDVLHRLPGKAPSLTFEER